MKEYPNVTDREIKVNERCFASESDNTFLLCTDRILDGDDERKPTCIDCYFLDKKCKGIICTKNKRSDNKKVCFRPIEY